MKREYDDTLLIILHPHPYLGGSPHNNVVEIFSELPFRIYAPQFYGLLAECELKRIKSEISRIPHEKCFIIGYSYGSLVAVLLAVELKVDKLLLVSMPLSAIWLCTLKARKITNFIKEQSIPIRIIQGSKDQFSNEKKIKSLDDDAIFVKNADHFWLGKEKELLEIGSHYLIN